MMSTEQYQRFQKFVGLLQKHEPSIKIKFKDESWFMKLLGFLMFFNARFMTDFVTTVGSTIYFPSREKLENRKELGAVRTMAHEFQHIKDHEKYSVLFFLGYMFPQLLAVLALPFAFLIGPFALLFLLALAPWPAFWRKEFELKGYKMNLFMMNALLKELNVSEGIRRIKLQEAVERYNKQFTSFNYYMMWPMGVVRELNETINAIFDGTIYDQSDIYSQMDAALMQSR